MADLRRTIIDASVSLIAKEGVRALSFREVARKARVSHQAPYHYFENHYAILKTIAEEGFLRLAECMEEASQKHKDPLRALTASGVAYVEFALENAGYFRVMFQSPLLSEKRKQEKMPEAEKAHNVLLTLAQNASASGIAKEMDGETLALLCWSTAHGIATLLSEGIVTGDKAREDIRIGELVLSTLSARLSLKK